MLEAIQKAERFARDLRDELKRIRGLNECPSPTPAQRALALHLQTLLCDLANIEDGLRRLWA